MPRSDRTKWIGQDDFLENNPRKNFSLVGRLAMGRQSSDWVLCATTRRPRPPKRDHHGIAARCSCKRYCRRAAIFSRKVSFLWRRRLQTRTRSFRWREGKALASEVNLFARQCAGARRADEPP